MEHRRILLAAAVVVTALLVTTVLVAAQNGPDVLTALSVLILGMLGFGIFGALRERR